MKYAYRITPFPISGGFEVSRHDVSDVLSGAVYVGSLNVHTGIFEMSVEAENYRFKGEREAALALVEVIEREALKSENNHVSEVP